MLVKGAGIKPIMEYVINNFGEEGLQKWIDSLEPKTKEIYSASILSSTWYPLKYASIDAEKKVCDVFHNSDYKKTWDIGRYVAETGLTGIYRFFIKFGKPDYILAKAGAVMASYFSDVKISVAERNKNSVTLHILQFDEITDFLEWHIAGWIEKALEIMGCTNIDIKITKSLANNDELTEYKINWTYKIT